MKTKFLFYSISIVFLFSCKKDNSTTDAPSGTQTLTFGNNGQIYYTFNALDTTLTAIDGNHQLSTFTTCYDIEKDTTLWIKRDSFPLSYPAYYEANTTTKLQYFKNYKIGTSLYRIYSTKYYDRNTPNEGFNNNPRFLGVYFDKINIADGKTQVFKQLISASELTNPNFGISNVIYDSLNNKFYFGCSNGKLYSVDINGTVVWQSSVYNPKVNQLANAIDYGTFLCYNNNKLVFLTNDQKIKAVNTSTGALSWIINTSLSYLGNIYYELLVTKKYVFAYHTAIPFSIKKIDLQTGNTIPSAGYFVPSYTTSQPFIPLDININDSTISFENQNNIYVEDRDDDTPQGRNNSPMSLNLFSKYLPLYSGKIFGASSGGLYNSPIYTSCLNYTTGNLTWQNNFIYGTAVYNSQLYDMSLQNNSLYLVTNFKLQGIVMIPSYVDNYLINGIRPYSKAVYLVTLSPSNGNINNQKTIYKKNDMRFLNVYGFTLGDK